MYILLAIIGISFLIFIHELGHYLMAKRVGMRVETFSIGFGRPLYAWEHNGTKWQIGWLPFGGYVKIAGTDLDKEQNPYEVSDGFFGKKPIDRIKVALMGPVANLLFAILAFALLWAIGGREKNFSEFTKKIGWVDTESELYAHGVRPGDEIIAYDDQPYQSSRDNLYAPMMADNKLRIRGNKINYSTGEKVPFDYDLKLYQHPSAIEKGIKTIGVLNPASYIFYEHLTDGSENALPEGSPLKNSGIQYGDRLVWVDGELVFSLPQLNNILSGKRVLLTIERNGKTMLVRVPRVHLQDVRPDAEFKEEITDWQFEAKLNQVKMQNLYVLPYNITNSNIVEAPLKFVDKEQQEKTFPVQLESEIDASLLPGDKIIAIGGVQVRQAFELLKELQTYRVNVIVQRNPALLQPESTENADQHFDQEIHIDQIARIAQSIGTKNPIAHDGDYSLLKPVIPKTRSAFQLSPEKQALLAAELKEQRKMIESIEDPERKHQAQRLFEQQEQRLLLGLPSVQDRRVQYNPSPIALFENVFSEIRRTLIALLSGNLNPKWMMGPIGIVQIVHDTAMSSLKEGLYWLGAISLNLGVLNLLPIPVLDGGTILMSMIEIVSGRKMHPKTLERLILPFAILLIGFFIFLTYNDVMRIFSGLWH